MPGAIIPDDWDGESFNCQKVVWPSSEMWKAILFGQITEPESSSFWDPDSGDVDDARQAIVDAEDLTSPDFFTEDCDVIPGQDIVCAFKALKTVVLGLAAATWTVVPFEIFGYAHNSPEFFLATNSHQVTNPELFGLWHYDLTMKLITVNPVYLRIVETPSIKTVIYLGSSLGPINMSFDYLWPGAGQALHLQVYSTGASSLDILEEYCQWSGHFVGPVS